MSELLPQLRAHAECHQRTTAIQKKNEIDHKVLGFVRQIDVNQITICASDDVCAKPDWIVRYTTLCMGLNIFVSSLFD